jgi:trehalose synthase
MALSPEDADYVVNQFGVEPYTPLMLQISRFDPWKDPLGVIDAYRIVKENFATVRLALVGSMATDDPEGWSFFTRTVEHAGDDSDILILTNLNNVGNLEVNAFQSRADALIQKSTREGFGLTVSEALWKAKPTVGGNVGGIPVQIQDGETGFLVDSVEECAERCMWILDNPDEAKAMGRAGKEHVRTHFLMPRLLKDYLALLTDLKQTATGP